MWVGSRDRPRNEGQGGGERGVSPSFFAATGTRCRGRKNNAQDRRWDQVRRGRRQESLFKAVIGIVAHFRGVALYAPDLAQKAGGFRSGLAAQPNSSIAQRRRRRPRLFRGSQALPDLIQRGELLVGNLPDLIATAVFLYLNNPQGQTDKWIAPVLFLIYAGCFVLGGASIVGIKWNGAWTILPAALIGLPMNTIL